MKHVLGIDIGGSGIKGAIVDTLKGQFLSDRIRIPTPSESTPSNILEIVQYIIEQLQYTGPIGIGVPGPIIDGKVRLATNFHDEWEDFNAAQFYSSALENNVQLINDADAAALAESRFGEWPGNDQTILFLTIGTGIGSSLWIGNTCIKNTELGQIKLRKRTSFEKYASDNTRKESELSWKKWGDRLNRILNAYDLYFSKPHFIIGGGVAKKKDRFEKYIDDHIQWDTAKLENEAGIIGAALIAAD